MQEKYQFFEELFDGVVVLDRDKRILFCNKPFAQLVGVSAKRSPVGQVIDEVIIPSDPDYFVNIPKDQSTQMYQELEYTTFKQHTGTAFFLIKPYEEGYLCIIRSSSVETSLFNKYKKELKEKEEVIKDLQVAQEKLGNYAKNLESIVKERTEDLRRSHDQILHQKKMLALSEVTRGIIHEINNPLTVIKGMTDRLGHLVKKNGVGEDKDFEKPFTKINKMIARITRILAGLKLFSKEDPGMVTTEEVNMTELVKEVLSEFTEICQKEKIDIRTNIEEKMLLVECNTVQIQTALRNLIFNAIDALKLVEHRTLTVECKSPDIVTCNILIMDNGPGIKPSVEDKIYQPFFTTDETLEKIGLGLSESKGIIEKHSGTLELVNKGMPGTAFLIALPLKI